MLSSKEIAIQALMRQLQVKAAAWNVTLEETRETPTSLLGFGVRAGLSVVLKITKHAGDESHSGKVLKAFGGDGAVRVYESETGAVLLERLESGEQLVNLVKRGEDDEATKILAQVMKKLAHHQPPIECPTVTDWGRGFDRYLASGDRQLPLEMICEGRDLYQDLISTQGTTMLLHGDLQHYNVLFDNERGWVAIDPKGVVGELEYEVGPLLRNPVKHPELFSNAATINRRLEILTTELSLNYFRALRWSYAQAILSAIWDIEDGYRIDSNPSLMLARILKPMLNK
jgi:streptomycin 6-kinase